MSQEYEFDEDEENWDDYEPSYRFDRIYSAASNAAGRADDVFREILSAVYIAGDGYIGIADPYLDYAAKCRTAAKAATIAERAILTQPNRADAERAINAKHYRANAISYIVTAKAAERVASKTTSSGAGINSRDARSLDDIKATAWHNAYTSEE